MLSLVISEIGSPFEEQKSKATLSEVCKIEPQQLSIGSAIGNFISVISTCVSASHFTIRMLIISENRAVQLVIQTIYLHLAGMKINPLENV